MENCLPFTDYVMVVLVHKCVQQTHLLALHLETLGYIPCLLNALNGLVYLICVKRPLKKRAKTDYRLMQVKSIAECSILQHFRPSLSYHLFIYVFIYVYNILRG